ncbi:hypothetical protein ACFU99_06150 [Streptomyces sp. NPDC057654]|uniref:hypothetical protein n=1 Tax=Streptomyces sp. NPDC057654 TaxID=3346196 RepID=UPI0036AF0116
MASARCTSSEDQEHDNLEWSEERLTDKSQAKLFEASTKLFASRPPMPGPWIGHDLVDPAWTEMSFTDSRLWGRNDDIWMRAPCRPRMVEVREL